MPRSRARPTEIATTIWALRRVDRRSALTFRRMSSSSLPEADSAPSRSRRPGARRRVPPPGWAYAPPAAPAVRAGTARPPGGTRESPAQGRPRQRSCPATTPSRWPGPPAWSWPCVPRLPRPGSASPARAGRRRSRPPPIRWRSAPGLRRSARPLPGFRSVPGNGVPDAATGRPAACAAARAARRPAGTGRLRLPRRSARRAAAQRRTGLSPPPPRWVVAVLGQFCHARHGRVRHGPAVRTGREDLAGEHSPVYPGDLADAVDETAQPPTARVLVPLLDEDHEVDRSRDQHVRGLDREPLSGLDRVGGDAVEHLQRGVRVDGRQ